MVFRPGIRQLAGAFVLFALATSCEVASGLRPRVFGSQFREESCDLMTRCGMYQSRELCLPTQPNFAVQEVIPDCPCYDANAARDCIAELRKNKGSCDAQEPSITYPEICTRVCCPDDCKEAACTTFRQTPADQCTSILNGGVGEAATMRDRLHDNSAVPACASIPDGFTNHFDPSVERLLPEPEVKAEVLYYGAGMLTGDIDTIAPCGQTVDELVLCASPSGSSLEHYVVIYETDEPVVQSSSVNLYELGVNFDADELRDNNFVPDARFVDDFFENTDQWFQANYNPTTGWTFKAFLARSRTVVQANDSQARLIIRGHTVALLVPRQELDSFDPSLRISLFRHSGDLGREPPNDWSGLVFPAQRQALFRRILRRPF